LLLNVFLERPPSAQPADKTYTNTTKQDSARRRDDGGAAAAAKAVAVEIGAFATEVFGGVIVGDSIVIQCHCTIERDGSTAQNVCGGIQGDALGRENIPCEHRAGTESRGSGAGRASDAHQPIHAAANWTPTPIEHVNRRVTCGRERSPYLENEVRIGVGREVEGERSCQLSRRFKIIDARRECGL